MVFSLCACEKSTPQNPEFEYVAYEVGDMDALDFGTHENEYTLWSSEKLGLHQDETVPLEMTVEFNGKTYVGEYSWSYIKMPNVYISDRYKSGKVFFEVNADTGALTYVMFARNPSWSATLTEDDCQKITDGIADDYIDLSAYQTKTSVTPIMDGETRHSYGSLVNVLVTAKPKDK